MGHLRSFKCAPERVRDLDEERAEVEGVPAFEGRGVAADVDMLVKDED
jgi:hypothetical protein